MYIAVRKKMHVEIYFIVFYIVYENLFNLKQKQTIHNTTHKKFNFDILVR